MAASPCKRYELILLGLFGSLGVWGFLVAGMLKIPLPFDEAGLRAADDALLAVSDWLQSMHDALHQAWVRCGGMNHRLVLEGPRASN